MERIIDNKRIRENLRKLRVNAKLSQAEVAEKMGVHPSTYKHLETDGGTKIIHDGIEKLPAIFGVKPETLFCGTVGEADMLNEDPAPYRNALDRDKLIGLAKEIIRKNEEAAESGRALLEILEH